MPMTRIDPEQVEAVFLDCLFLPEEIQDGKPPADAVIVEGIVNTFGFHPERLVYHRARITDWLALLPNEFRKSLGGGWSFLNACDQADGKQWTGLHQRMEQLFALAIGLKLARWQLPRDMWDALPGGMPYVEIEV